MIIVIAAVSLSVGLVLFGPDIPSLVRQGPNWVMYVFYGAIIVIVVLGSVVQKHYRDRYKR